MHHYVLRFHVFTFHFKFGRRTGLFSHEFKFTHIFWSNRPEQKDIGSTWNKNVYVSRNAEVIREVNTEYV